MEKMMCFLMRTRTFAEAQSKIIDEGQRVSPERAAEAGVQIRFLDTLNLRPFSCRDHKGRVRRAEIKTHMGQPMPPSAVAVFAATQLSWPEIMGLVVLEGLLITVLVLTGFRKAVFRAIPAELKAAIAAGIGLFIALIGFVDGGFVRAGTGVPLQLGSGSNGTLRGWPTVVFLVGLLVTGILVARKVKAGVLIGIVATTVVAVIAIKWLTGLAYLPLLLIAIVVMALAFGMAIRLQRVVRRS